MPPGHEFDVMARSCRFHAERWGPPSAPLVLGLPELAGNIKRFAYLGERLGGDDIQLVAFDLRGRGQSETGGRCTARAPTRLLKTALTRQRRTPTPGGRT
jgi:alpha-beta hydrolase superfamily lysophospholipase